MLECEIRQDQIPTELSQSDKAVKLKVAAASNMLIEAKTANSPMQLVAMKRLVGLITEPTALDILKELQKPL